MHKGLLHTCCLLSLAVFSFLLFGAAGVCVCFVPLVAFLFAFSPFSPLPSPLLCLCFQVGAFVQVVAHQIQCAPQSQAKAQSTHTPCLFYFVNVSVPVFVENALQFSAFAWTRCLNRMPHLLLHTNHNTQTKTSQQQQDESTQQQEQQQQEEEGRQGAGFRDTPRVCTLQ